MGAHAKIPVETDDDFRARHVGASEVAALFDASPYLTRFELWHRKKGNIATPEFDAMRDDGTPDNERIYWGIRLEAAIIEAAKERYGYTDREQVDRLDNGGGLGCHPDRRVACPQRGPGVLEIKCVDWLERKSWGDEPPLHYLLQSQTQQGLDGVTWGDVLVLVGGNKLERFQYDFRPKVFAEIEKRTAEFWRSVEADEPPPADYSRDLDAIRELYGEATDETVDLRSDNLATDAALTFLAETEKAKEAQGRADAAKAELLDKLGHASTGFLEGFTVRTTDVKPLPEREAKPGEIIPGRKGYRRFSVKEQN
ncbi:MAG: YqaJ viral recombinase family protein [Novosphingobium sp.]|nr:YqaJ viral recombinase family protein [Novosphingobium sp.]